MIKNKDLTPFVFLLPLICNLIYSNILLCTENDINASRNLEIFHVRAGECKNDGAVLISYDDYFLAINDIDGKCLDLIKTKNHCTHLFSGLFMRPDVFYFGENLVSDKNSPCIRKGIMGISCSYDMDFSGCKRYKINFSKDLRIANGKYSNAVLFQENSTAMVIAVDQFSVDLKKDSEINLTLQDLVKIRNLSAASTEASDDKVKKNYPFVKFSLYFEKVGGRWKRK